MMTHLAHDAAHVTHVTHLAHDAAHVAVHVVVHQLHVRLHLSGRHGHLGGRMQGIILEHD